MSDNERERTVFGKAFDRAIETALVPVHAAISKPAQRAYLGTFLFATASLILLSVSTVAYWLFYYNYVPQIGVERIIHLQFGNGHPYGVASIPSSLVPLQPYDITFHLHLPRTPSNLLAGNFMIDLALLAPTSSPLPFPAELVSSTLTTSNTSGAVLALSRRPAILTYASPIVEVADKISGLPWYMLGWRKESEVLEVSMFEGVVFAKGGRNVPESVQVIVEAEEKMQFYEAGIKIVARFGGLRYILYNHRILSYLFFTTTFFSVALTSTLIAYLLLTTYISPSSPSAFSSSRPIVPSTTNLNPHPRIKPDPDSKSDSDPSKPLSSPNLSDTSRTFPTLGRQIPLHFSRRAADSADLDRRRDSPSVKLENDEDEDEEEEGGRDEQQDAAAGLPPFVGEADDEDEDGDGDHSFRDSGIGTGFDDDGRRGGYGGQQQQRRRKGGLGSGLGKRA